MPDPTELQQARKDAADRFYAVGMSCLPDGWTHAFRKYLTGRCYPTRRHIDGPHPVTRKALYKWLHECAHAHLHADGKRRLRHVKEYEAERWAHAKMREHGIAVPKTMTVRAKAYVARKIKVAERRGTAVDAAARKFTKGA